MDKGKKVPYIPPHMHYPQEKKKVSYHLLEEQNILANYYFSSV